MKISYHHHACKRPHPGWLTLISASRYTAAPSLHWRSAGKNLFSLEVELTIAMREKGYFFLFLSENVF